MVRRCLRRPSCSSHATSASTTTRRCTPRRALADAVLPLFVVDPAIVDGPYGSPNRRTFLADCLDDLRRSLRQRHADLVVVRGDPAAEVTALARRTGASAVYLAADASGFAWRRHERLAAVGRAHGFEVIETEGVAVVAPGSLRPPGGDHYKVFTPYFRAWSRAEHRTPAPTPRRIRMVSGLRPGAVPCRLRTGATSPHLPTGGETFGRRLWRRWRSGRLARYDDGHDDLGGDCTSRTSPYLHFGCLSPDELARDAAARPGGEPFVRQLAWRDFFLQVTAAFPDLPRADYRPARKRWRRDAAATRAWAEGRTGMPIVDAGMRQLLAEGWMHNRARLVCASYLVHDLGIDWRVGARHFLDWLVDGDIASNSGNWQWVAGTGNNPRPNRVMNPYRQAARFDRTGAFVARYTG